MATTREVVVPKERFCDRVSEAPVIGRLEGEDMLTNGDGAGGHRWAAGHAHGGDRWSSQAAAAEAIGRRSADCSSATTPSPGGIDGVSRMHIRSSPVEG
jgi:hypothetical protein